MKNLFFIFVFLASSVFFAGSANAQKDCAGGEIFTEKKCRGDETSADEKELLRLVNEYRVQHNLPVVPFSNALNLVANRHLLDLRANIKSTSHSWSNCPYNIKDESTWNCVFNAPQRLGTAYTGRGYENVYRNIHQNASPPLAIAAWKNSPPHNALLINQTFFKNDIYDACGIAIDGNFAILWFGTQKGGTSLIATKNTAPSDNRTLIEGLGLNFEKAINGLSGNFTVPAIAPLFVNRKWAAVSVDKSIRLEIVGDKNNVTEASIKIRAKLVKNKLEERTQKTIQTFLANLIPNWVQGNNWAQNSLQNLLKNPKTQQSFVIDDKFVQMSAESANFISLTVKYHKKPVSIQKIEEK